MIIGLCGKKQHGKSTVAAILRKDHQFVEVGFADALRDMLKALDPFVEVLRDGPNDSDYYAYERYTSLLRRVGYEKAKQYSEVRRLLQRLGTEAGRNVLGENVWVQALATRILSMRGESSITKLSIAIADVRFENEADMVRGLGGVVVRVVRPGWANDGDMHTSEQFAMTMPVEATIHNSGSITDLRVAVTTTLAMLREGTHA